MAWQDKIRNPKCRLCSLHEEAEHVCLMGTGSKRAKIMIVGEAPGAREDEEHRAFVGPAGQLLDEVLQRARLDRSDVYITNSCKCRPPGNRTPDRSEITTCSDAYLRAEIDKVDPDFILALGNSALYALTRRTGITRARADLTTVAGRKIFPVFHPAYILRQPQHRGDLDADFARFGQIIRGEDKAPKTKVRVVKTLGQLRGVCRILETQPEIAYDIETNELQEWREDSAIVSIAITTVPGESIFVPLWHRESPWKDDWQEVLRILKPIFERSDAKYIAHNGKFDARWLAQFGIYVLQTFDTMLSAHMLNENRPKELKSLAQTLLGVPPWAEHKRNLQNMVMWRLALYNGRDTDYTFQLRDQFREEIRKPEERRSARVFVKLMMPASNALTRVERRGMWLDQERWEVRYAEALRIREGYREAMLKHVPKSKRRTINFNSHPQVAQWFFRDLELPILERTERGAPSTKESVLLQLAKRHAAPRAMLEYRRVEKWITTYFRPYGENHDKHSRIHTSYRLFGTVTGRLSSSGPNLQQVPRDKFVRSLLGAPRHWSFVEADYSQIELRIAAWLANESVMRRAFHTGADLHLQTAAATTGKFPGEITSEERKKAKAVNFGFLYGMGHRRFVDYALDNYDVEVTEEEAYATRERFFQAYPGLRPWHDRQRRLVQRYGFVSSPFGRMRRLPTVWSEDRGLRAEAERQAINSPVQSCASDFMLLSLIRLEDLLRPRVAFIVGTIHDAIGFQILNSEVDEYIPLIKRIMEDTKVAERKFGVRPSVPIEVEVKVGQHWGEGEVWN
jgi:uracil-DNA glycosylase family 4